MLSSDVQNMLEEGLPKLPVLATEKNAIEYVGLIYSGMTKIEAFQSVFSERSKRVMDRAKKQGRSPENTLLHAIATYEQGKFVHSVYAVGAENYYIKFVDKRTNLLNEIYDIAMNKGEKMNARLNASKIFLGSIPEPKKEILHKVEVDVKDTFQAKLAKRQKELYSMANNENEILDAEITDS